MTDRLVILNEAWARLEPLLPDRTPRCPEQAVGALALAGDLELRWVTAAPRTVFAQSRTT